MAIPQNQQIQARKINRRTGVAFLALAVALLLLLAATLPAQAQTFTVLYTFKGTASGDGQYPSGGLVLDRAGNLYGVAGGGAFNLGTVFKLDASGPERVLYHFGSHPGDGTGPQGALVMDGAGNLYGITMAGGDPTCRCGGVFKLGAHGMTVLHNFSGSPDGAEPFGGLFRQPWGVLYGTTWTGGTRGYGTVFRLDLSGNETVVHSFWGGDGGYPLGPLVGGGATGILYGTVQGGINGSSYWGTAYKLTTNGKESVLHRFSGGADGAVPAAGLILDKAGNVYGTTYSGGAFGWGEVFKFDTNGNETVLYSFTGHADGGSPEGALVQDAAGNFYGTTAQGGTLAPACAVNVAGGCGVVFKLDPNGNETVLHTFSGADGATPSITGLVQDEAGNLYGTTAYGGDLSVCGGGCGVVFKITP